MARLTATNYTAQPFTYATAATDLFKKEDVQVLAQAVDGHDHTTGKGLILPASAIPDGSITSAKIADGTIDTVDLKDSAVTSVKIADGTIATVDLANAAVTNAKLASDVGRANLLTNGGFEVWQRGNGPFASNGTFTADRWYLSIAGTDTLSISRNTANADTVRGSIACGACTFTLGTGAGGTCFLQALKATDSFQIKGQTVSLSMRVSTASANAVRVGLNDGSAWTYSSFHTGAGGYQTLTVTATVGAAADLTVGIFFVATCTAYLDSAMLVVGSQAADYVPLHPADELARCLRYYEKFGGGSSALWNGGYGGAGGACGQTFYQTTKAVGPTLTKTGTWTVSNCGQPVADITALNTFRIYALASATGVYSWGTTDATTYITSEANP
jgi:hypothetical protein